MSKVKEVERFRKDLLFHEVTGIDVNWMESYGNTPRIKLRGPIEDRGVRKALFGAGIWKQYPVSGTSLWVLTHPNGFVEYLAHSGRDVDEGGFGGAVFTVYVEGGHKKELRGPWSSRATCVNMVLPSEDHIMDTDQGAIRIDAFIELCKAYKFPCYVVRGHVEGETEPEAVEVSTRPDGIFKPSGMKCMDYKKDAQYEVLYSPEG